MEKFQELREKALRSVKAADHMLGVSYPLLADPKILVSVANNLLQAADAALSSVLEHEKLYKKISTIPDGTYAKYLLIKQKAPQGFQDKNYDVIKDLVDIVEGHKASPVGFPRNDKYVIASQTYELRTLTTKELGVFLVKVRGIVEQLYEMTSKNDGIFR